MATFAEIEADLVDYLAMPHGEPLKCMLAAAAAVRLDVDPVWMFFVAPSSSGKTEMLMMLDPLPSARLMGDLSINTMLSGLGNNASLLHIMQQTGQDTLLFKDFTTILQKNRVDRDALLAQLREIYEGSYSKETGGKRRKTMLTWRGKIAVLAAVTPKIDSELNANQLLGERFLIYRLPRVSVWDMSRKAISNVGTQGRVKLQNLQQKCVEFYERVIDPLGRKIPSLAIDTAWDWRIRMLAMFTAQMRAGISRTRNSKDIEAMPEAEGPGRLTKQFTSLALGLMVVGEQSSMDQGIYGVLHKTALDSIFPLRLGIIRELQSIGRATDQKTLEMALSMPPSTVRIELENLMSLGVLERTPGKPVLWGIAEWFAEITDEMATLGGLEGNRPIGTRYLRRMYAKKESQVQGESSVEAASEGQGRSQTVTGDTGTDTGVVGGNVSGA